MSDLAHRPPTAPAPVDWDAALRYLNLNPRDPKAQALVMVADRYALDPLLGHISLYEGKPYIHYAGYLYLANSNPHYEGAECVREWEDDTWNYATVRVHRDDRKFYAERTGKSRKVKRYKDRSRGTYVDDEADAKAFAQAHRRALRLAFNVAEPDPGEEHGDETPAPEPVVDVARMVQEHQYPPELQPTVDRLRADADKPLQPAGVGPGPETMAKVRETSGGEHTVDRRRGYTSPPGPRPGVEPSSTSGGDGPPPDPMSGEVGEREPETSYSVASRDRRDDPTSSDLTPDPHPREARFWRQPSGPVVDGSDPTPDPGSHPPRRPGSGSSSPPVHPGKVAGGDPNPTSTDIKDGDALTPDDDIGEGSAVKIGGVPSEGMAVVKGSTDPTPPSPVMAWCEKHRVVYGAARMYLAHSHPADFGRDSSRPLRNVDDMAALSGADAELAIAKLTPQFTEDAWSEL